MCPERQSVPASLITRRTLLTVSLKSNNSNGFLPPGADNSPATPGAALTAGLSSDAKCTSPSRNAYSASKNAFVIFAMNACGIACYFTGFEIEVATRSTPPASL